MPSLPRPLQRLARPGRLARPVPPPGPGATWPALDGPPPVLPVAVDRALERWWALARAGEGRARVGEAIAATPEPVGRPGHVGTLRRPDVR